ncbi:MAG: hypothetical protein AAF639_19950 [Chloroflexota bacterium]
MSQKKSKGKHGVHLNTLKEKMISNDNPLDTVLYFMGNVAENKIILRKSMPTQRSKLEERLIDTLSIVPRRKKLRLKNSRWLYLAKEGFVHGSADFANASGHIKFFYFEEIDAGFAAILNESNQFDLGIAYLTESRDEEEMFGETDLLEELTPEHELESTKSPSKSQFNLMDTITGLFGRKSR